MDLWPEFVAAAVARYGVADVELAEELGIAPHRFYRRTDGEGWRAPAERVRVHPSSRPSLQVTALSACLSTTAPVAASLEMAAWLHGLRSRPPNRASAISTASTRLPALTGLRTQRARWLCADDIVVIRQVPTLEVPAIAGTDWVCVPVDRRDWHRDRPHVLAAIDAAIATQRRRGVGADVESPRRAS
jgi:hypothetical protein